MVFLDAWELAQQLVAGGHSSIQPAISEYAVKAAPRSVQAINGSRGLIAMIFSQGLTKLLVVIMFRTIVLFMGPGLAMLMWVMQRAQVSTNLRQNGDSMAAARKQQL